MTAMTASEIRVAVKMTGEKSYGQYVFRLGCGLVTPPPLSEIRARLVDLNGKKRTAKDRSESTVNCYSLTGQLVASYPNAKAAAEVMGVTDKTIQNACNGNQKTSGGFQWRYADDAPPGAYEKKPRESPITKVAKVKKKCARCGKLFEGLPRALYCSDECRKAAQAEATKKHNEKMKAEREAARVAQPTRTVKCKQCGKIFTTTNPRAVFCSDRCRITSSWQGQKERKKAQNRK